MKAQLDFIPGFCANCGKELFQWQQNTETRRAAMHDFMQGEPFTCECGFRFWYGSVEEPAS